MGRGVKTLAIDYQLRRFNLLEIAIIIMMSVTLMAAALPALSGCNPPQWKGTPTSLEQRIAAAPWVCYRGEPYSVKCVDAVAGKVHLGGNGADLVVPVNGVTFK